jgi:hypothetical protein
MFSFFLFLDKEVPVDNVPEIGVGSKVISDNSISYSALVTESAPWTSRNVAYMCSACSFEET